MKSSPKRAEYVNALANAGTRKLCLSAPTLDPSQGGSFVGPHKPHTLSPSAAQQFAQLADNVDKSTVGELVTFILRRKTKTETLLLSVVERIRDLNRPSAARCLLFFVVASVRFEHASSGPQPLPYGRVFAELLPFALDGCLAGATVDDQRYALELVSARDGAELGTLPLKLLQEVAKFHGQDLLG